MATKDAIVVSDGLSYKLPGQERPVVAFGFAQTYLTNTAARGEKIELDAEDYDRFKALGSIADPDTHEAAAAQAGPLWGPPANAVKISSEDGNLPVDKLRQEATRLGFANPEDFGDDFAERMGLEDDEGVSGAAPADLDYSDAKAVGRLNVAQLKAAAAQRGVEVGASDSRDDLVAKLVTPSVTEDASGGLQRGPASTTAKTRRARSSRSTRASKKS